MPGRVGMIIDTSVKGCRGIFTDRASNQTPATRVLLDKGLDIVNDALDQGHGLTLLCRHLLKLFKSINGQLIQGCTPDQGRFELVEFLLTHTELSLFDLVGREPLEIRGETQPGTNRDEPFRRVVLIKSNRVSVIGGELVMEVVVSITLRGKRGGLVFGCSPERKHVEYV